MSLLRLDRVTKYGWRGGRPLLDGVSLEIQPGEMVGVWGARRSGKTTLCRIAAGIELSDDGAAFFDDCDLAKRRMIGRGIAYVCPSFHLSVASVVVEHVAIPLLSKGYTLRSARRRALEVLHAHGVADLAELRPPELNATEATCAAIVRALVTAPRLLVVDEPTDGVDPLGRETITGIFRSIANDGTAVLMTTGEVAALRGSGQVLTLGDGELRGIQTEAMATVIPLRRRAG